MRSSRSERASLPDVLALPADQARARLARAGLSVRIVETAPPDRRLLGEPRVVAARSGDGEVLLIVARAAPLPRSSSRG